MRGRLETTLRVFFSAIVGAAGWVLAGCGWGVVIGSALEAAFGRGTQGLLDAAGETGLEAAAGGLAGMMAGALLGTLLYFGTLVPLAALLDKQQDFCPPANRGLPPYRSTRLGVLIGLVCGASIGTSLGALQGAAYLLDSIQGRPFSFAFVQVSTRVGIFLGGIVGAVALGRTIYRQMAEVLREGWTWPRVWSWGRDRLIPPT
jgi:hypothetical protein